MLWWCGGVVVLLSVVATTATSVGCRASRRVSRLWRHMTRAAPGTCRCQLHCCVELTTPHSAAAGSAMEQHEVHQPVTAHTPAPRSLQPLCIVLPASPPQTALTPMSSLAALAQHPQQQSHRSVQPPSSVILPSIRAAPPSPPSLCARVTSFLIKHHLPIGIVLGVLLGALYPPPGLWLASFPTTTIAICFIFCVQGLRLDTEEAKDALRSYRATLYGAAMILFVSPFLSFPLQWMPLDPPELTYGLCLFLCMPTTISTGVIFTREAHGNSSLALLLCIGTTLLSIPLMPFTIPFFALRSVSDVSFDTGAFLLNLCLTIGLPLVIGKSVRQFVPRAPEYIERGEPVLKYGSSVALLALPYMQVCNSAELITRLSVTALLTTLEFSIVLHLVLLAGNWLVCHYGPLAATAGRREGESDRVLCE